MVRPTSRADSIPAGGRGEGIANLAPYAALAALIVAIALVGAGVIYQGLYGDRIYLGVTAMGVELGGFTPAEAKLALGGQFERYLALPIAFRHAEREWRATPRELGLRVDVDSTVEQAFAHGRIGSPMQRARALSLGLREGIGLGRPGLAVDRERRAAFLAQLAREVDRPAGSAQLALKPGQKVAMLPSRPGQRLNVEKTAALLDEAFEALASGPIVLVVEEVRPTVSESELAAARALVERALGSPIVLEHAGKNWRIEPADLAAMVELRPSSTDGVTRYELLVDESALKAQAEKIARQVESAPQNGTFTLRDGRVVAVQPGVAGQRLDVPAAMSLVRARLTTDQRTIPLPIVPVPPALGTAQAETMKFPDLLERASTPYGGTLPDRMFNVELAAQRLNGTIILPGEVFSFNEAVGEVSVRAGYKVGFGISQDGDDVVTIPSEGGGICQVATTVFQAAFWSGVPIVERNWHLYWIPRYGQPPRGMKGLDATIDQVYDKNGKLMYAVDLRWRNTTAHPILVETGFDGKDVTVAFWGTAPGWNVSANDHRISRIVKADTRPVYQHDASLAPGAQLMIEHAEDGFEATVTRIVTLDGKTVHEQRFASSYRPSRNVYLTGAASAPKVTRVANDRPANPGTPQPAAAAKVTPAPDHAPATATPAPARGTITPARAVTTTPAKPTAAARPAATTTPPRR